MDEERVREIAAAAGLKKLTDKQLTEFAAAIASGRGLAEMLPKDLHWSEESALVFRLPMPARSAR